MREAGFGETIGTASRKTWATAKATRAFARFLLEELTGSKIVKTAIAEGWADKSQQEIAASAINGWGAHPDAMFTLICLETVARKESANAH